MWVILEERVQMIIIEQQRGREAANYHESWELLTINRFDNRRERAVARIEDAAIVVLARWIDWWLFGRHYWVEMEGETNRVLNALASRACQGQRVSQGHRDLLVSTSAIAQRLDDGARPRYQRHPSPQIGSRWSTVFAVKRLP
jgi:hypothetical protein